MVKKAFFFLSMAMSSLVVTAEQYYVNARTGNDAGAGTQALPLRTLQEAARRINMSNKREATTILLSEGVYMLTETVLISNNKFTAEDRLVIRAEVLPDDPGWTPQRMPIIASAIPTQLTPGDGEDSKGLELEASHVTVEGLRFTGSPLYYYIDGKQSRRYYPIWREGKTLDDLLVTQCLFAGDVDLSPVRVAVIANGHGLVLDHCVFIRCENPVVFWEAEGGTSYRNAMRYCLAYGSHYSGVWTTTNTAEDFEFHHNIIAGGHTAWIKDKGPRRYKAHDCIFTGNDRVSGLGNDTAIPLDFLQAENLQTTGTIEIEKNQGKNNYLQLKEGSFGSDLKAGLFKK